ncbi:MAG TPA: SsrA-binding protein SmpB [Chloroflexia bacterium]|nr:SsrA-binding protein SmpB [Chloroflexia bacterium]
MNTREQGRRDLAVNRKAFHDYAIDETIEAGLVLVGSEIKSLRDGKANLRESYVRVERGEAWLINAHIGVYPQGGTHFNHEPLRRRKLLLHGNEIIYLRAKVEQKGLALVPIRIYLLHGKAKLEVALGRGKKLYDKRDALAERDAQRDIARAVRGKL